MKAGPAIRRYLPALPRSIQINFCQFIVSNGEVKPYLQLSEKITVVNFYALSIVYRYGRLHSFNSKKRTESILLAKEIGKFKNI